MRAPDEVGTVVAGLAGVLVDCALDEPEEQPEAVTAISKRPIAAAEAHENTASSRDVSYHSRLLLSARLHDAGCPSNLPPRNCEGTKTHGAFLIHSETLCRRRDRLCPAREGTMKVQPQRNGGARGRGECYREERVSLGPGVPSGREVLLGRGLHVDLQGKQ